METKTFKATFIEKIQRTENVTSFRFDAGEPLSFCAGQFVQVLFDEENLKNTSLNKYLSLSDASGKKTIEVTKKLSESDFSQKLKDLKEGQSVLLKGPMGNCFFEEHVAKIGFIVGGIGITPVISMLEYIESKKLSTDVVLLYSNWTEKDIAFKKELDRLVKDNTNMRVEHVLVEGEEGKNYDKGMINKEFIAEKMSDFKERVVFIFGPPKMVGALESLCLEMGAEKSNLRIEKFLGY